MEKDDVFVKLLEDDSFVGWVQSGSEKHKEKWDQWVKEHPEKQAVFVRAQQTIRGLSVYRQSLSDERKELLRKKILADIHQDTSVVASNTSKNWETGFYPGYKVAAAILLLFSFACLLYWFIPDQPEEVIYATAYGEIKTFMLPDSSRVTLNGNSTIRYVHYDQDRHVREAWLSGEGFFDIRSMSVTDEHMQLHPVKFNVHTDNLSIDVLGTRFNVKHRRDKTQIVLEEGKIQLKLKEQPAPLLMQPDEMVEISQEGAFLNQKPVNSSDFLTWKEGFITFDAASFSEISNTLKENYGLELHFAHESLKDSINLRGSFPADNVDILLEAIANITHTSMTKKGKEITYQ